MKAGFQTFLSVDLKPGADNVWIIDKPLEYWSELSNCLIVVPPWFETDFASVPRMPLFYEAYGNRAHMESVIHDYLYRIDSVPVVPYSMANRIFLEAMKARGKNWFVRAGMYLGVVLGGWTAYHKKSVNDKL